MSWLFIVQAAVATIQGLSNESLQIFHGGALNTATKVNSALSVLSAFLGGTASSLTAADVHPDLAAHAAALATTESADVKAVAAS